MNGGPGVGGRLNPARATLSDVAAFKRQAKSGDRVVIDKARGRSKKHGRSRGRYSDMRD